MRARLSAIDHVAEGTAAFTFELAEALSFEPGQTCDLTLPAPKYHDEHGISRTFSIASSPADLPSLMVATRLTGAPSSEPRRGLAGLEVGSTRLRVARSTGMRRSSGADGGGIGITPFRCIVKDAAERRCRTKVTLFYSNRTARSTAFLADLEAWEKQNPNFRLVATITEPDGRPWSHDTGLMDEAFIGPRVPDATAAIYYVAGPPAFVKGMRAALEGIGGDPDNIRTEEFAGY
jgi:ferredoxin-NADP reductase